MIVRCDDAKKGKECCGCCDETESTLEQHGAEFREKLEKCESEEDIATLRFTYLNANGVISKLLQNIPLNVEDPQNFHDTVAGIFGLKTFVRSLFFLHLFEKEVVEPWLATDGRTADIERITDKSVAQIVDDFLDEQGDGSPFEKIALYTKYLGSEGRLAEAWDTISEVSEPEALRKGINLIKAESHIELSLYLLSRAVSNMLAADGSISWTDIGVYRAHIQFMHAITTCESNDEARALYNAYLGDEGVFAKRFAQFSHKELANGNAAVAQWKALRDHVTAAFKQMGVKAAKV